MECMDLDHDGYLTHTELVSKLLCKEEADDVVI